METRMGTEPGVMGRGNGGWLGRQVVVLVLGVLLGSLSPLTTTPAGAGLDFCAGDPILRIGSDTLSVVVQIPVSALAHATPATPVRLTVNVPAGVTSQQIAYTGIVPELVQFQWTQQTNNNSGYYTIAMQVLAPDPFGTGTYPVRVSATSSVDSESTQGVSGQPVPLSIKVKQ
jgi:hypothetical protein